MPSVLDTVSGLLRQGDSLSKLGGALGTDPTTTQRAIDVTGPSILSGMADRVQSDGNPTGLVNMLEAASRATSSSPQSMTGDDGGFGLGLVGELFGSNREGLVRQLAGQAGVSTGVIGRLLPMLAPVIMGVVAKRRTDENLSDTDLTNLLTSERNALSGGLPSFGAASTAAAGLAGGATDATGRLTGAASDVTSGIGGVADNVGGAVGGLTGAAAAGAAGAVGGASGAARGAVGGVADRVSGDVPKLPRPDRPSGRGGLPGWLKWLLPLLAVLLIGGWALSQCGDEVTDAVDDAASTAEGAVDAAGDAVEGAVDGAGDAVEGAVDTAGDAVEGAVDGAEDAVDAAGDAAEDAVDGTVDGDDTAPSGPSATDLQASVDDALTVGGFSGVTAQVAEGGVVTLTGDVGTETARTAAAEAIQAIAGVTSVTNEIVVADESASAEAGTTINEILDLDPITFAVNSADITPEGQAVLAGAVEFMKANPGVNVEIGGHTDSDGDDAFNLALSQERADSVKAFLVAEGVEADRMSTRGYGEAEPKVANDSPANKAINRRIEFTIQ